MAETWDTVAVPLMRIIDDRGGTGQLMMFRELADELGISAACKVDQEVERLIGGGFIGGKVSRTMTGGDCGPWRLVSPVLLERGARTVGTWPSDDPFEDFLERLEEIIAAEPDEDKRTKLRKVGEILRDVGKGTVTAVLVKFLTDMAGLT